MKRQKEQKNRKIGIIPFLVLLIGVSVLLYPTASNYYNVVHSSNAIMEYAENLSTLDNDVTSELWEEAIQYNADLYQAQLGEDLPEQALQNYDDILRVSPDGMMGFIDIAKISVHLPIYHGTNDAVLQKGVGHLEWTSFPVAVNTEHIVLTGHTGLPSAKLFTDLDKLVVGDTFILKILGEKMTYEIYDIEMVLPYEVDSLHIVEDKDLCTLVTCTPYGVNSHRLLVHAKRIENAVELENDIPIEERVEKNAKIPMLHIIFICVMLLLLFLTILFWGFWKKKNKDNNGPQSKSKKYLLKRREYR